MTAAPLLPQVQIEEQASCERARAFFERDRLLAAYALADLDATDVERARWWIAARGREDVAGAIVVEALPFRPCFATGDREALAAIFRHGIPRPRVRHEVVRLGPEHLDDVIDLYGHASRTYFTPDRLAREIYYGIYAGAAL